MTHATAPYRFHITVEDLTTLVDGTSRPEDASIEVKGFASLAEAEEGDVTFYTDARHGAALRKTRASAVLVPRDCQDEMPDMAIIRVDSPTSAFDLVVDKYGRQPPVFAPGVHASAVVSESATLDRSKVSVGANAVIDDGATIGDGTTIGPGCYVGKDAWIGADVLLHAHAAVHDACAIGDRVILHTGVVIGADGFGYEFEAGRHRKVKQRGMVQIDSDVEIGANSTIDRARYGRTRIGTGTKIDNLVQIGHNAVIGRHCILVAGCAIAGSAIVGDYVIMGAQTGVGGHVTIGAQARLGARCGVTKDLAGGQMYLGFPAIPAQEEKRRMAGVNRLAKLSARVRELEAKLEAAGERNEMATAGSGSR